MSDTDRRAALKDIADRYNEVGLYDPDPRMRALAQVAKNGNTQVNPIPVGSPTGQLSAATPRPGPQVQDIPQGMGSDVSAPEGHSGAGTFDQMAAIRAKQLQLNNAASQPPPSDFDPSGYAPYPGPAVPQPRQFPHIQAKMQSGQPVTTQDIRATTSPTQALSPDDEDAINKQLNSKDDEDED